jgi:predicted DNA binding CopG/RHH family protein
MDKRKMDKDERDLLESYERGEWRSIDNLEGEAKRYRDYAHATFRKDSRVNIRISSKDLQALQNKALEEGIPYQTLISSVLHKYINGRLTERTS